MNIAPQLAFDGQCRQAFEFYADLLGGEIVVMNSFAEHADIALPPGSTAADAGQIRFAEIRIGDSLLRGNDLPADQWVPMSGFNIALHSERADDARRIFAALSDGGTVTVPLGKVDWAARFGMVTDKFGVPWLVLGMKE
jgi:PhnB protein